MDELLAALRQLREALSRPAPAAGGVITIPLTEEDAERIAGVIAAAVEDYESLPEDAWLKLSELPPVWGMLHYVEATDRANRQRARHLSAVRHVEAALCPAPAPVVAQPPVPPPPPPPARRRPNPAR